jgi:hypothetical protein
MSTSVAYIAVGIAVLAIASLLFFVVGRSKREKRLSPLAGLAFALIFAGIFFGDNRLIGYSLLGVGVILAIIDIVNQSRKAT